MKRCASIEWKDFDQLQSVEIGADCFTNSEMEEGVSPSKSLSISSCPLQTLVIGNHSFGDFGVLALNDLPSLTTVRIGTLGQESSCFAYASLRIKSRIQILIDYQT